jgi:hypothetical protein
MSCLSLFFFRVKVAILALVAVVAAAPGKVAYIAAPAVVHTPVVHTAHVVHAAPVLHAPVLKVKTHHVPIATSYANTYKVSVKVSARQKSLMKEFNW